MSRSGVWTSAEAVAKFRLMQLMLLLCRDWWDAQWPWGVDLS